MDTPNEKPLEQKIVNRKDFLLAAAGTTAFLGMTGQAKATGTQAYLDSVETFSAPQTFMGPVYFQSGYPWVDVSAYGILPTNPASTNTAKFITLFNTIFPTGGSTDATGNPTIYFPPGEYQISDAISPPNSASNYTLRGAGPKSSRIIWEGNNGASMLKLVNARGVTIRDLCFFRDPYAASTPAYGIEINRVVSYIGSSYPGDHLFDNLYIGGISGNAITTGIGYTATSAAADNVPAGFSTFRNVHIENVGTGYKFGTAYGYGNIIIRGLIANSSAIGIDSTPGTNSSYGGSYSIFGLSTGGGGGTLYQVGQTLGTGLANSVFGMMGEDDVPVFIYTPSLLQAQMMSFFGGVTLPVDSSPPPNVITYNSTGGALEFHDFQFFTSNNTMNIDLPGSAAVGWFGGAAMINQLAFNGPFQIHGMLTLGALTPSQSQPTNMGSGIWQEYGHDGTLVGAASSTPTYACNGAMRFTNGSGLTGGATITVNGTDVAGIITLTVPAGHSTGGGELGQINFALPYPVAPVALIFPAETNSAGQLTNVYTQSAATGSFQLAANAAIPGQSGGLIYQWSYLIIG